jgi:hypothetical protein
VDALRTVFIVAECEHQLVANFCMMAGSKAFLRHMSIK